MTCWSFHDTQGRLTSPDERGHVEDKRHRKCRERPQEMVVEDDVVLEPVVAERNRCGLNPQQIGKRLEEAQRRKEKRQHQDRMFMPLLYTFWVSLNNLRDAENVIIINPYRIEFGRAHCPRGAAPGQHRLADRRNQ